LFNLYKDLIDPTGGLREEGRGRRDEGGRAGREGRIV